MSLKLVQQQFCVYLNIILLTSSFSRLETEPFLPSIWKWSWTQRPEKQIMKQTSILGGRKCTLVFHVLAAMVIGRTSVQQQRINPSWPSILTCDKRGGRKGGGGAPIFSVQHFRVPGHQQALESPQSLGRLYSWRSREKERKEKRGGRGALILENNVWSRPETWAWHQERVEKEVMLSQTSTELASCFGVFVCPSLK